MKTINIAILNYKHAILTSVVGPYEILLKSNQFLAQCGIEDKTINVQILSNNVEFFNSPIILSKDRKQEIYDLILIPAFDISYWEEVSKNEDEVMRWVKWQYEQGAEVGSFCLGAFLLAKTGLLDRQYATTHWLGADMFRKLYPNVNLIDSKIITDYKGIYTSGGAYSFTTFMIYLLEKYFGKDLAILASKVFLINTHDMKQDSFAIFNLQKNHNEKSILQVQEMIEEKFTEYISVEQMANFANMSLRTFIRKFKKSTGLTPLAYLQRVRIENAKKLLESSQLGIEQITFDVGYSDFSAFRKVFKKNVGMNPSHYKKLYGFNTNPELIYTKVKL